MLYGTDNLIYTVNVNMMCDIIIILNTFNTGLLRIHVFMFQKSFGRPLQFNPWMGLNIPLSGRMYVCGSVACHGLHEYCCRSVINNYDAYKFY